MATTLREIKDLYFTVRAPQLAPHTACNYRSVVRCHFGPLLDQPLAELTPVMIAEWLAAFAQRYPRTARTCLMVLKAMLKFGREMQLYDGLDPCLHITQPHPPPRRVILRNDTDTRALLASLAHESVEMRLFFQVLLETGARKGEVRLMRWDAMDWAVGVWRYVQPKTKLEKVAKFKMATVQALQQLPRRSAYVFTSRTGKPFAKSVVHRQWSRIRARAGLEHLWLHDLRRTFITDLDNAGVPLQHIQRMAGHAKIATTQGYSQAGTTLTPFHDVAVQRAERLAALQAEPEAVLLQPAGGPSAPASPPALVAPATPTPPVPPQTPETFPQLPPRFAGWWSERPGEA